MQVGKFVLVFERPTLWEQISRIWTDNINGNMA